MTWLWEIEDLGLRVDFVRTNSPTDFFTLVSRYIVSRATSTLALLLMPVDSVMRFVGRGLVALALGLLVLLILTGVWFPIWGLLVGTSWAWLKYPWLRPCLFVPGILLAIGAHVFIMLVPDPHKNSEYWTIAREWPLSWRLWKPSSLYYEVTDLPRP